MNTYSVNTADTLFVLLSAALVMLMTPGLALFYGGMVRKKNILSMLMQCFAAMCVLNVWWIIMGYKQWILGWIRLDRVKRRRVCAYARLFFNDPQQSLHDLSIDVCRYNPCPYYRGFCGTNEIFRLSYFHLTLGYLCLRAYMSLGMGKRRMA